MPPHRCQYCGKGFKTPRAVNHHISASKSCSRDWRNDLYRKEDVTPSPSQKRLKKESLTEFDGELDHPIGLGDDFVMPSPTRGVSVEDEEHEDGGRKTNLKGESEENERFIESFPGEAGKGLRKSKTQFEVWLENQKNEEKIPWFPFASEQEWDLAKWLLKNVGQSSTDEFLKLPIVRETSLFFPHEMSSRYSLSHIRLIARKSYLSIIPIRF
jgi:hypothetical protein